MHLYNFLEFIKFLEVKLNLVKTKINKLRLYFWILESSYIVYLNLWQLKKSVCNLKWYAIEHKVTTVFKK